MHIWPEGVPISPSTQYGTTVLFSFHRLLIRLRVTVPLSSDGAPSGSGCRVCDACITAFTCPRTGSCVVYSSLHLPCHELHCRKRPIDTTRYSSTDAKLGNLESRIGIPHPNKGARCKLQRESWWTCWANLNPEGWRRLERCLSLTWFT